MSLSKLDVKNYREKRGSRSTKEVSDNKSNFINWILDYKVKITTIKFYYVDEIK